MCFGAVSGPIQYNWVFVLRSDTVCIGAVLGPIQCVSDPSMILYSLHRFCIGPYTECFRDVKGPILCVSDLYRTLYIAHGVGAV